MRVVYRNAAGGVVHLGELYDPPPRLERRKVGEEPVPGVPGLTMPVYELVTVDDPPMPVPEGWTRHEEPD